ncbi:MAG: transposase family protein [Armatimonadota bacterium]
MLQRRVLTSTRLLRAVTGFSRDEFHRLLPSFAVTVQEAVARERGDRPRRRRIGGGRKGQLSAMADKLLFILVYVHLYPIQEVQGVLFSLGQSQASEWAIRLLPVLQAALGKEVALPTRPPASMEALCTQCPDLTFLLDATERPIPRPGHAERQRQHYSGKKKRHTVKNTVITDRTGRRIVYLGATVQGSTHDKTPAEAEALPFPPASRGAADRGYQGYSPPNLRLTIPLKKPPGGELTAEEKAANTALAKHRIDVEHAIRGIKRQRIAADIFRNTSAGLIDLSIEVAAGVYNLTNQYRGRYTPSVN